MDTLFEKTGGIHMAASLQGTKTMENLMRAFAGESQARNRYTFAAACAKKKQLYVIEQVF